MENVDGNCEAANYACSHWTDIGDGLIIHALRPCPIVA